MEKRWGAPIGIAALACFLLPASAQAGEGFGTIFNRDFATLWRTHPPRVFLSGTRIALNVTSTTEDGQALVERLRAQMESEIIGADPRLKLDSVKPETTIETAITQNAYREQWESRTVIKQREVGKDAKGKPTYQSYEDKVRYKVVFHDFNIAYKCLDTHARGSLDAETYSLRYRRDFEEGNGAPDRATLESSAISGAVEFVRSRLTPSREAIGVLVPRGSLKGYSNLAEAGLWNQYLEALQSLTPLAKPDDDAYRLYGIGLAHEALGYAAETTDDTLRYLQQASVFYGQALQTNPQEKYFSLPYERHSLASSFGNALRSGNSADDKRKDIYPAPLDRVKAALIDYQRVKEFSATSTQTAAKALDGTPSGTAAVETTITNADIIDMVKAGLSEDVILTAIDTAANPAFDASPKGLIELGRAKVSKTIIQKIQSKVGEP